MTASAPDQTPPAPPGRATPTGAWAARGTLQIAALIAGLVMALSLVGMGVKYRLVSERIMAAQRAALGTELDGLAALYEQRRIIALYEAIELRAAAATGAEILILRDRDGRELAAAGGQWPEAIIRATSTFDADAAGVFETHGTRWLGVVLDLPGGFPLLVARSLAETDRTLAALRRLIAALTLGMLALAVPAGWWAARRVMRRIGRLNALADSVGTGALDARPERRGQGRIRDEFDLLDARVHAMLDRIATLNRATHRLSDTIAHELRTPLGRIAGALERIEGNDALRAALTTEIRATIRLFDALLDISRAEAATGSGGGLVPVDLASLAEAMAELYAPLAEEADMALQADITPAQWVLGDRVLIGQMLANLLENAVKYCRTGDRITLRVAQTEDGGVLVCVTDTGPGLPPEMRDRPPERFSRGTQDAEAPDEATPPGHGLGLALVQAITARHGARLWLEDAAPGLAVSIRWPPLPQDLRPA